MGRHLSSRKPAPRRISAVEGYQAGTPGKQIQRDLLVPVRRSLGLLLPPRQGGEAKAQNGVSYVTEKGVAIQRYSTAHRYGLLGAGAIAKTIGDTIDVHNMDEVGSPFTFVRLFRFSHELRAAKGQQRRVRPAYFAAEFYGDDESIRPTARFSYETGDNVHRSVINLPGREYPTLTKTLVLADGASRLRFSAVNEHVPGLVGDMRQALDLVAETCSQPLELLLGAMAAKPMTEPNRGQPGVFGRIADRVL